MIGMKQSRKWIPSLVKSSHQNLRLTVGVNLVNYPGESITPMSDLNTVKLHINSVISDIISCYMYMEVKDF